MDGPLDRIRRIRPHNEVASQVFLAERTTLNQPIKSKPKSRPPVAGDHRVHVRLGDFEASGTGLGVVAVSVMFTVFVVVAIILKWG